MCRLTHSPLTRHVQKKLSGHPNIVQFCSAASVGKEESDTGQAEFLLLTELCKGNILLGSEPQQCHGFECSAVVARAGLLLWPLRVHNPVASGIPCVLRGRRDPGAFQRVPGAE